uniref:Protein LTV1 homolog n=1 Tax=Clastoptera arizonana TaxID=38151 RepID=A0A1B6E8N2_9HEMI
MPKNKKKFIDKKNAITFHLVHRSQQDPLTADENAPQHVLLPALGSTERSKTLKEDRSKRKEEQLKYGIYFDDDYDYLQHLRDPNVVAVWEQSESLNQEQTSKLKLPSSVFASEIEEDVGLLNKAAPESGLRLDLDPDIVAAMDEDFDYSNPENELEDDFVQIANGLNNDEVYVVSDEEYVDSENDYFDSENDDEVNSLRNVETKSRFTEYSMTSSVIRRNKQLTFLDDKFEQIMTGYDDVEIGALDCDEIEGDIDPASSLLLQLADEAEMNKPQKLNTDGNHLVDLYSNSSEEEDEIVLPIVEKDRWDCESFISTYSNLYNHPKLITEPQVNKIQINKKTGIPMNGNKLTAKNLAALGGQDSYGPGSIVSAISTLSIRNKNESPKEKKIRKQALKKYRQERRVERKLNTEAFKEEKKRMEKILRNNKVCAQAVHF